jgi:Ca-activated chloride channel homolog
VGVRVNGWVWLSPGWWPLLLVVLVLAFLLLVWSAAADHVLVRWFGRRHERLLGRRVHQRRRGTLALFGVLLAALSALEPAAPGAAAALAPDVVFVVDVSRSMLAADVAPSRFAAAQSAVRGAVERAVGARIGLVAFAGEAVLVAPLTEDGHALGWLLEELAPGFVDRGGTDVAAAIEVAAAALGRARAIGEIVVLTDGEDFGDGAERAAAAALAAGHRVHAIGIGSAAGSKITIGAPGEQRFLRDAAGNDVVTRLDRQGLAAIASAGGGSASFAPAAEALASLYDGDLAPAAARRKLAAGGDAVVPRWPWLLSLALACFMLRACLPERRR